MPLPKPSEYIDLADGQSLSFTPVHWQVVADELITPPHAPEGKVVRAIRIQVRPDDKVAGPPYWDLTASTLVAHLEPMLRAPDFDRYRYTLTARGIAARKRYTVDRVPV